jgi:hypothetical protein
MDVHRSWADAALRFALCSLPRLRVLRGRLRPVFRGQLELSDALHSDATEFVELGAAPFVAAAHLRTLEWPLPPDPALIGNARERRWSGVPAFPALTSATLPLHTEQPLALLRAAPLLSDLHVAHGQDLDPLDGRCLSALRAVLWSGHQRLARIQLDGYPDSSAKGDGALNDELGEEIEGMLAADPLCALLPSFQRLRVLGTEFRERPPTSAAAPAAAAVERDLGPAPRQPPPVPAVDEFERPEDLPFPSWTKLGTKVVRGVVAFAVPTLLHRRSLLAGCCYCDRCREQAASGAAVPVAEPAPAVAAALPLRRRRPLSRPAPRADGHVGHPQRRPPARQRVPEPVGGHAAKLCQR